MRLIKLLAVSLISIPAWGTFTPGNHDKCRSVASPCTVTINMTGVNLIFIALGSTGSGAPTSLPANTWIPLTMQTNNTNHQGFYAINPTVSSSMAFTSPSDAFDGMIVKGYTATTTPEFGVQFGSNGGGGASLTSIQSGTVSAAAYQLVIAGLYMEEPTTAARVNSELTISDVFYAPGGSFGGMALADSIPSTFGSPSSMWSWTGGSRATSIIATFHEGSIPTTGLTVTVSAVTNTQATLTYTAPSTAACTVEVSPSNTYSPLIWDVDASKFANANLDSRGGALLGVGTVNRIFVVGKRAPETSPLDGLTYSRALQAYTLH
jgi:hypothetical protein